MAVKKKQQNSGQPKTTASIHEARQSRKAPTNGQSKLTWKDSALASLQKENASLWLINAELTSIMRARQGS